MLVTVGASEAIAAAVLGLVEPGSEVLLVEPYFDTYAPVIAMAGAHRVSVPLVADGRGFALDVDAVRAAITPRTRAIDRQLPAQPDRHGALRRSVPRAGRGRGRRPICW